MAHLCNPTDVPVIGDTVNTDSNLHTPAEETAAHMDDSYSAAGSIAEFEPTIANLLRNELIQDLKDLDPTDSLEPLLARRKRVCPQDWPSRAHSRSPKHDVRCSQISRVSFHNHIGSSSSPEICPQTNCKGHFLSGLEVIGLQIGHIGRRER